jgi:predicted nicotinamide N-methyase
VEDQLVTQVVDLPRGELSILQPAASAELPDDGEVEWAPLVPYWSVLWRSGRTLAEVVDEIDLRGRTVVELGCGLGAPSLAAARAGADVLATDAEGEALELLGRNADLNDLQVRTARVDWSDVEQLVEMGPFDLVLGADVLYDRASVAHLLSLLPRLAPEALIADPGRDASSAFLERAWERWDVEARRHGVIAINAIRMGPGDDEQ